MATKKISQPQKPVSTLKQTDLAPKPLKPLTPEERRKGRDAFNALLDAPDDDKQAITTVVTVQSLLMLRKKRREELRTVKGSRHGR